ncbi:MAG: hypothetical protein WCV86_05320 [Patescibacteria group bacterium]|jgi:hypothetical protein
MDRERIIYSQVPKEVWDKRSRVARVGETLFGDESELISGSWDEANDFVRQGKGLLVVANHPTLLDGPRIVSLLMVNPEFRGKRIVVPVAQHQFAVSEMLNKITGAELELISVVTPDTIRKKPELASLGKQGLFEYGRRAGEVLFQGGIVILFPQAERRPRIGEAQNTDKSVKIIMRIGENKGIDFGVLPVGITIPGVDPEKARGLNIGRKAILRVGNAFSRDELRDTAKVTGISTDAVVYRNLQVLVDEDYR